MIDLIVRGDERDIAVEDGVIAGIAPEIGEPAREEVDARGLHVLPGAIDAHVHFNDPGRADWEGWATGTAALAAGGATACVEMPLNAHPPTVDGAAFDAKVAAATGHAAVDFALWGGLVPGDLDRLDELAARGVVGFKAFMCDSGIEDFQAVDDEALGAGMQRAAALGLPVAVHAERPSRLRAPRDGSWQEWAASRPPAAELAAIERALELAEETGCSLHVVHVSIAEGVAAVAEARRRGVDATCETCPHYLVLRAADMERLGTLAKCAPPLRDDPEALWEQLEHVTLVGSDHSPCPPAMKAGGSTPLGAGSPARRRPCRCCSARACAAGFRSTGSPTSSPARPPAASACPARAAWRSARTPTSRWCRSAASTPSASCATATGPTRSRAACSAPASSVRCCAAAAGGTAGCSSPRREEPE